MINVLNIDNEIVMQLTEADITRLLDVAKAAKKLADDYDPWEPSTAQLHIKELTAALKEVEDLLDG